MAHGKMFFSHSFTALPDWGMFSADNSKSDVSFLEQGNVFAVSDVLLCVMAYLIFIWSYQVPLLLFILNKPVLSWKPCPGPGVIRTHAPVIGLYLFSLLSHIIAFERPHGKQNGHLRTKCVIWKTSMHGCPRKSRGRCSKAYSASPHPRDIYITYIMYILHIYM